MALRNIQVELEFGNVGFYGGRKTGVPGENPRSKDENQQQTQPTEIMTPGPGIEPGPHWWKASVLTTVPSLLPHWVHMYIPTKPVFFQTFFAVA